MKSNTVKIQNMTKGFRLSRGEIHPLRYLSAHREQVLQCLFLGLIFWIGTYRLSEIWMPILYDDEYGYWAGSAFLMGTDWSSVTSYTPYYSYGYGVLLVPLRLLYRWCGWSWRELYQSAAFLNVVMLAGSYLLACRICRRYMERMHWVLRSAVCFTVIVYSSNIVYSHITWTENALYFFFWVFLSVLMYCIDRPGVGNHMCLALSAFYLYTIHQRAVAEVIAAVLIVLYMRLNGMNRLRHTAAFFGSLCACSMAHGMIKGKLQNDFYMGRPPADLGKTLSYIGTPKTLALLLGCAFLLAVLYLLEKGRRRELLYLAGAALVLGAVLYAALSGGGAADGALAGRITNNDFAGQWGKLQRLLTLKGILRLLISITGKWFYLAAATGLVICWGMGDLLKHLFWMTVDGARRAAAWLRRKEYAGVRVMAEHRREDVWKLGVLLSCTGSFPVCAIYKEGLYKVDDLVNGRYNEFVAGVLIVYGFYCLLEDRHWLRTALICLALYLAAGALCQYVLNEVQRTEFELGHCVMFGRVFWNWEVPVGKVRQLSEYVLPMSAAFLLGLKAFSGKLRNVKFVTARALLCLLLPVIAWTYLGRVITDKYTIPVNLKQAQNMPSITSWIMTLDTEREADVYYLADQEQALWAETIQFILQDQPVTMTNAAEAPYEEDAFFVMSKSYGNSPEIQEKCATVAETHRFALVVPRGMELERRLKERRGEE